MTLKDEFDNPSDDFVVRILNGNYEGMKTTKIKDKFRYIIKNAIAEYFNDMLKEKLENAF